MSGDRETALLLRERIIDAVFANPEHDVIRFEVYGELIELAKGPALELAERLQLRADGQNPAEAGT